MTKTLILSRTVWESEMITKSFYRFTKEQLDAAEKLQIKFIGNVNGVKCYLTTKLKAN